MKVLHCMPSYRENVSGVCGSTTASRYAQSALNKTALLIEENQMQVTHVSVYIFLTVLLGDQRCWRGWSIRNWVLLLGV